MGRQLFTSEGGEDVGSVIKSNQLQALKDRDSAYQVQITFMAP